MAEPIEKLFSLPAPEQVVVLARGPSLLNYEPARHPGAVVIGVNDIGIHRYKQEHEDRRCDYTIFIDAHLCGCEPLGIPLRPEIHKLSHGGEGYYWNWSQASDVIQTAFGRTGSAAIVLPWLWGCRDIVVYGMDSYPDCKESGHAIVGIISGPLSYISSVRRQKQAIEELGIDCITWAHMTPVEA